MKHRIYYDNVKYRIKKSKKTLDLIEKAINGELKTSDGLSFIITSDEELLKINREFLGHDYYTDVIAFGESCSNMVSGEIYISADTVKRNALNYKVSFSEEMFRVMIHGVLHICGYDDHTEKLESEMKRIEDRWVNEWKKQIWSSNMIL